MRLLAALMLLASSLPALAGETITLKFRGYAYDLDSGKFLYTELHEQRIEDGQWKGGTIDYLAPDGSELGHKTLDFGKDPYVPVYRLDLKIRGGYMEAITDVTPERIDMARQGYGEKMAEHKSVKRAGPITGDSGFHAFIRGHFRELLTREPLNFRFAVAGNLDAYKFRARRIDDTTFEGKPAVRFRVEPDSLLRWLVDPLELTYDPDQRKLLEYHGISNVHDPATGKAYNARIIYPSRPPAPE